MKDGQHKNLEDGIFIATGALLTCALHGRNDPHPCRKGIDPDTGKEAEGPIVDEDAKELCDLLYAHHVVKYDPAAALRCARTVLTRYREAIDRLMHAIDRDRYVVAVGIQEIQRAARSRSWLAEGRGPYEYDDETYQKEFGVALDEISKTLDLLRIVASDKSDCTKDEAKVSAARAAAHEVIRLFALQPYPRPMLATDIGLSDGKDAEIARLRAEQRVPKRWADVIPLVEQIVSEEAATVSFTGQNPDFNGLPNECVIVNRGPDWQDQCFRGDTLADCLRAAIEGRKSDV